MGLFTKLISRYIPGAAGDVKELRKAAGQGNVTAKQALKRIAPP